MTATHEPGGGGGLPVSVTELEAASKLQPASGTIGQVLVSQIAMRRGLEQQPTVHGERGVAGEAYAVGDALGKAGEAVVTRVRICHAAAHEIPTRPRALGGRGGGLR